MSQKQSDRRIIICIGWESQVVNLDFLAMPVPPSNYKDEDKKRAYVAEARREQLEKASRYPLVSTISRAAYAVLGDETGEIITVKPEPGRRVSAALCQAISRFTCLSGRDVSLVAFRAKDLSSIVAVDLATAPANELGSTEFFNKGLSPLDWAGLRPGGSTLTLVDPYDIVPLYRMQHVSLESVLAAYSKSVGMTLSLQTAEAGAEAAKAASLCLGLA